MMATNRQFGQRAGILKFFGAKHGSASVPQSTHLQSAHEDGPKGKANYGVRFSVWMCLAMGLLLMFPALKAFAQYDTGSVVGEVRDATGAVLPGATVTVLNKDTASKYAVVSGSDGEYEVPSLHTGNYRISAEHPGFSTSIADNVTVSVGARQRIDLTLEVGKTETTVEVTGV